MITIKLARTSSLELAEKFLNDRMHQDTKIVGFTDVGNGFYYLIQYKVNE